MYGFKDFIKNIDHDQVLYKTSLVHKNYRFIYAHICPLCTCKNTRIYIVT